MTWPSYWTSHVHNIAISLKAFNDFTFRSLAETIYDVYPDCKIIDERVQFIPNLLLPTAKEIQAIKKYKAEDDELIPAELFFRQLVPIKRIDEKVEVLQAMSTFDEHVKEARAGFKTLQEVCGQITISEKAFGDGGSMEAGVLALLSGTQRGLSVQQSLLRVQLGQKVNTLILEKAQTLSLVQFENSEFYDKLVRVRREASTRPLALVMKSPRAPGWVLPLVSNCLTKAATISIP